MQRRFAFVIAKPEDLSQRWNTNTLRPLSPMPPLGVLTLSATLRQHDWEVRVFDNSMENWPPDRLLSEVLAFAPRVVGLSMTSLNAPASLELATDLAKHGIPVLAGGPHASVLPKQVSSSQGIWAVVAGEAEEVIVPLADAATSGAKVPQCPGIYEQGAGEGVTHPPMNLNLLPPPARELIDLNRYTRLGRDLGVDPVDSLATSRGCPYLCTFCSNPGNWSRDYRCHRTRSADLVADEMEMLAARYGSRGFFFREDNFTASRNHVLALCDEFQRRGFRYPWKCEAHVSTLDEHLLERMAASGLKTIWLGIESGSDALLQRIGKGFTVDRARRILLHAKRLGLRTASGFLLGLPGQTEEDVRASIRLAEETGMDDAWFQIYVGFPGSKLYKDVVDQGLVEAAWNDIVIPRGSYEPFAALTATEERIRQHFRRRAHSPARKTESYYAVKGAWSRPGTIELACQLIPDWGQGRHLDIGCGVGKLLDCARNLRGGREGVGMDLTYRLLATAKTRFACPDHLIQGDGSCLPFADRSFDVVTATEVLEHVPDLDKTISEIARVLLPGGWFVLTMPTYTNMLWLDKYLGDRRLRRTTQTAYGVEGLHLGWAPWEPEPTERSIRPRDLLHRLRANGLLPQQAFTRNFFVTLDRCFVGQALHRLLPHFWQTVQHYEERIDSAIERLGRGIPCMRFAGYKLFCLCQRSRQDALADKSETARSLSEGHT